MSAEPIGKFSLPSACDLAATWLTLAGVGVGHFCGPRMAMVEPGGVSGLHAYLRNLLICFMSLR